jgi:hypothetical protein
MECDGAVVEKRHQPRVEIDLAVKEERLGVLDWDVLLFPTVVGDESERVVAAFESAVRKDVVVAVHC